MLIFPSILRFRKGNCTYWKDSWHNNGNNNQKNTAKQKIQHLLKRHESARAKGIDLRKYCGIIRLKDDPLALQKPWRDEWK
jgi:hypothetical protein